MAQMGKFGGGAVPPGCNPSEPAQHEDLSVEEQDREWANYLAAYGITPPPPKCDSLERQKRIAQVQWVFLDQEEQQALADVYALAG